MIVQVLCIIAVEKTGGDRSGDFMTAYSQMTCILKITEEYESILHRDWSVPPPCCALYRFDRRSRGCAGWHKAAGSWNHGAAQRTCSGLRFGYEVVSML